MKKTTNNRQNKGQGGGSYAALAILTLVLLAIGGYFYYRISAKPSPAPVPPAVIKSEHQPAPPPATHHQNVAVPDRIETIKPAPVEKPTEPAHSQVKVPVTAAKPNGSGKLAIIIDDMGANMSEARALSNIGVTLTFSIIPGLRSYREVASFAATNRIETMVHIPMQSKGWPARRLESNGLLISMSSDEIRSRLESFFSEIPNAVGANNHMGSEFTEHSDKMMSVLAVMQKKGLFFVDSVTSPQTVGFKLAHETGVRSARRNVFLDNEQNSAYILGQLDQAVKQARKNGSAIAICHPHPMTIKTLAAALPAIEKQGIKLVAVSTLVK